LGKAKPAGVRQRDRGGRFPSDVPSWERRWRGSDLVQDAIINLAVLPSVWRIGKSYPASMAL
jgi:hypothetical protein